jgi:peptidoglycan/LPS O-acetylase OafA/YrhL
MVFFILSGYLITHTLEENIESNGKLRFDIYIAARAARLYPAFLYAIAVSLIVFFVMDLFSLPGRHSHLSLPSDLYAPREMLHLSPSQILQALFMLQGMLEINGPLWSLYIEAKLYVLLACAFALLSNGGSSAEKLIFTIVFCCVAYLGLKINPDFAGYAAIWMYGATAYYVWNSRNNCFNPRFLMCVALIIFFEVWSIFVDGVNISVRFRTAMISALVTYLLFKIKIRLPNTKFINDCSYSLYVTHFPVLLLTQSLLISSGSASMEVSIGLAIVSTLCALVVAGVGGAIEQKKTTTQKSILNMLQFLKKLLLRNISKNQS